MKTPGTVLRSKMDETGVSEAELADYTGLSRALISQILQGNRRITPTTAVLLGWYFDCSPEDFLVTQMRQDLVRATDKLSRNRDDALAI